MTFFDATLPSGKSNEDEVAVGTGKNLAVFRGDDGRAHVLDAYCCHNGANLAVGGLVKASCLECPFHGWQFRGDDGKCTHIPYCDRSASRSSSSCLLFDVTVLAHVKLEMRGKA